MKEFLIYAPPYDPNSGGSIVLHKLCDLINRSGRSAFIYPNLPSFELNAKTWADLPAMKNQIDHIINQSENFKTNPEFITPVIKPEFNHYASDDQIVIYPEIVFGNPLQAKNVARWILYYPGFHTGKVYYGDNEIHFLYNEKYYGGHAFPSCTLSTNILNIDHFPISLYLNLNNNTNRSGIAYCTRKNKSIKYIHNLEGSISIDGKSHEDVSNIFKKCERFISYDPHTAYSVLAAISGCESVIAPTENSKYEDVYPNIEYLDGIAYGISDIDRAKKTLPRLIKKMQDRDTENIKITKRFIAEVDVFFQ